MLKREAKIAAILFLMGEKTTTQHVRLRLSVFAIKK